MLVYKQSVSEFGQQFAQSSSFQTLFELQRVRNPKSVLSGGLQNQKFAHLRVHLEVHAKVCPNLDPSELWRARDLKFATFIVHKNLGPSMSSDGFEIRSSSFSEFVQIFVLKFIKTKTCKSSIVQNIIFFKTCRRFGGLETQRLLDCPLQSSS